MSASTAGGPACYVPHEGDAVLLDEVWPDGELITRAVTTVRAQTPFCDAHDGWPAWLVIELMAQVVAASAGLREYRPGLRPRLGLLLGVRSWRSTRASYALGERLQVQVTQSSCDETGMGVFDCTLTADGSPAADAILTVYLPESAEEYLLSLEP